MDIYQGSCVVLVCLRGFLVASIGLKLPTKMKMILVPPRIQAYTTALVCVVLETKPKALYVLNKHSTNQATFHRLLKFFFFFFKVANRSSSGDAEAGLAFLSVIPMLNFISLDLKRMISTTQLLSYQLE